MSTLEKKLSEYEAKQKITTDAELISALRDILNREEALPFEKRDYDLIEETVDALLTLEGKDSAVLNGEAENVAEKNIKNKPVKLKKLRKILLAAATLTLLSASLLTVFSVIEPSRKNMSISKEPVDITVNDNVSNDHSDAVIKDTNQSETDVFSTDETEKQDGKEPPIGGSDICEVHNFGYHCYPDEIIEYIGEDRFREWSNKAHSITDEEGCWPNGNILICIEHFDVPDAVVIEAYQNDYYNHDWDMEALLARDAVAFERYARFSISSGYADRLFSEMLLKYDLFDIMKKKNDQKTVDYYNRITNNGTFFPVCNTSIAEIVWNTSLSKEDLESNFNLIMNVSDEFKYNIDLLFEYKTILEEKIDNLDIPYYESKIKMIDALLHIEE